MIVLQQSNLEWLKMMRDYSPLTDCKPRFASCAAEIEQLVAALERSLSWLSSYPANAALGAYDQARAAIAAVERRA